MALIVPHDSRAAIATANAGQAAQARSASAFVTPAQAGMPRALNQLAHGTDRLGRALNEVYLDRQRMQNATDLLADKVAYEDALRGFDSNYRQTRKGVDARTAEEDYNAFHKEQYGALQKKWGGNPFLMEGVNRMASGLRARSMERAVFFRDQQEQAHQHAVLSASRAQALQVFADPSATMQEKTTALMGEENTMRLFAGQRREVIDGKEQWTGGKEVTAELMTLRQGFHTEHVESLIATNKLDAAQGYMRAHAREFGANGNKVSMMLEHKIESAARRNEIAAIKRERVMLQKQVDDVYAGIRDATKALPLAEQQSVSASIIGDIEDPDVRRKVFVRLHDDLEIETLRKKAEDYKSVQAFSEYVQKNNLLPSQALRALDVAENLSDEARDKARTWLDSAAQRVTPQNMAATNKLKKLLDTRDVVDDAGIEAFAFDHGLTTKQVQDSVNYRQGGGNTANVTVSRVEGLYKRLGKGTDVPIDLYDHVLDAIEPGKPVTDERLRKIISNLVIGGESIKSGWFGAWDKDETYASALTEGRGDAWLPDVTAAQRKEAAAVLRKRGHTVTDESVRLYVKEETMGIKPKGTKKVFP